MDPVLDRYASRATPRYTSYPTAPHFQKDFDEARYREWLSDLDVAKPVAVSSCPVLPSDVLVLRLQYEAGFEVCSCR